MKTTLIRLVRRLLATLVVSFGSTRIGVLAAAKSRPIPILTGNTANEGAADLKVAPGGGLAFPQTIREGYELMDDFTELQLRTLSSDYAFYCCTDGSGKKETGRYIAVSQYQEPVENDDHTYNFEAFIGILNQPNSPVRESTLTNTFIDQQSAVGGKNPAAVVAKSHPNLIRALLA